VKIGLLELILIQFIIYMGIYLLNSYVGIMICLVMAPICFFTLIVSLISELLDRSKVPKLYYKFMVTGFIIPLIILLVGLTLDPNALDWMTD